ncbi:MAG: TonB-dependent receptor [Candidatus Tectomicrobia bacterium]|uniref:TonB-dependent receptor n=1 Tax=Tectimicrobiota bacterium TaxID=2528274 RepID=A0A932FUR2_UNCTE|nr:TonB-dependent receptor [Candidatus Tectomicrobia bacterium]
MKRRRHRRHIAESSQLKAVKCLSRWAHGGLLAGFILVGLSWWSMACSEETGPPPMEPGPFPQNPVVVTATRLEQPLDQLTSSVTVITQEEIERQQAVTVEELLRRVPGVLIQSQGSLGEEVNLRIRGAAFNQVLVLLDGQKVNSPLTGEFDLGDLQVENIERIEVIRGGLSALYGSEAMGGVVNILTRTAAQEGHHLSLSSEGGSQRAFIGRAMARGRIGERDRGSKTSGSPADLWPLPGLKSLGYAFSFSRTTTNGQFSSRDGFESQAFSGLGELDLSSGARLRWTTRYIGSRKELAIAPAIVLRPGVPPQLGLVFDDDRDLERSTFLNTLWYQQALSPWWSGEIQGSWVEGRVRDANPPDRKGGIIPLVDFLNVGTRRLTLGTQHSFTLGELDTLTVGIEAGRERISLHEWGTLSAGGAGPRRPLRINQDRHSWALYGQNQLFWGESWILNLGLRWDESSQYGGYLTPRASLAYLLTSTATQLIAGLGQGFRAPSFAELYAPGFGHRGLDPEESRTFEVGLRQPLWNKLHLEATYFATRLSSLIAPDFTTRRFENRGKGSIEGIEMRLGVRPWPSLTLAWNYTWIETRDHQLHQELPRRPRHSLDFNLRYAPGSRWAILLDVETYNRQRSFFPGLLVTNGRPLGQWTSGYTRLRLVTTYDLKDTRLFCRIDNLLDRDFSETGGMPGPGINFWLGIRTGWGRK